MLKIRDGIVELYRKVATSIPPDVEKALLEARAAEEEGSKAAETLDALIQNARGSRKRSRLICIETGVPAFYVSLPKGMGHGNFIGIIKDATRTATTKVPLSSNAVDVLTERNSGDNTGEGFPIIHITESETDILTVDLMLRCAECETQGATYSLPDKEISDELNLEGIRKCVLDAVRNAGGRGCPPYTVGVGAGASKDQATALSREQLKRKLPERADDEKVAAFEDELLRQVNALGIGPMGSGGNTTALTVKVGLNHRMPSSFVVDVYLNCWALRRGRLIW